MSESLERFVVSKIYRVIFACGSDVEKDEKLKQKITELAWLDPKHLDIVIDLNSRRNQRILAVAVDQLKSWNQYKSPKDKMICILNACKAVWKLLGSEGKAAGADDFLPHLIFTVIRANPPNLYSNVEYISRYRNPSKMHQEFGYYFTQLASVVPFLEGLSHKSLTISEAEFNKNVLMARNNRSPRMQKQDSVASLIQPPPSKSHTRVKSANSIQEMTGSANIIPTLPRVSTSAKSSSNVKEMPKSPKQPQKELVDHRNPLLRFLGRDVETLTLKEVKEMYECYEELCLGLDGKK